MAAFLEAIQDISHDMFGFLDKRSTKVNVYYERWFERHGDELRYFRRPGEHTCRRAISLVSVSSITVSADPSEDRLFTLKAGNRVYVLRAPTRLERNAWVNDLRVWTSVSDNNQCIQIPCSTFLALRAAIGYCRMHGPGEEGVFRVPGALKLVEEVCRGMYIHADDYFKQSTSGLNVFAVGSAVKKMLRDLPEPLLTRKLSEQFLVDGGIDLDDLEVLIQKLPQRNRVILKDLCELCLDLCSHSAVTKMTPRSLAISFGPSISGSFQQSDARSFEDCLNNMIFNEDKLFRKVVGAIEVDTAKKAMMDTVSGQGLARRTSSTGSFYEISSHCSTSVDKLIETCSNRLLLQDHYPDLIDGIVESAQEVVEEQKLDMGIDLNGTPMDMETMKLRLLHLQSQYDVEQRKCRLLASRIVELESLPQN